MFQKFNLSLDFPGDLSSLFLYVSLYNEKIIQDFLRLVNYYGYIR